MKQRPTPDAGFTEDKIPQMATKAFRGAYARALEARGHILIARNGQLGEIKLDGSFTVVRKIKAPTQIAIGTVRIRTRHTEHE